MARFPSISRFSLRRRKLRKERTPYYMTGITQELARLVMATQADFIRKFGRDYEDEDPQWFLLDSDNLRPQPQPVDEWLEQLGRAMLATKHPAAQVHAMRATRKIIFGCGNCFDMDHCPACNFRSVPEGWTLAWQDATKQYEKWSATEYAPAVPTTAEAMRILRRG